MAFGEDARPDTVVSVGKEAAGFMASYDGGARLMVGTCPPFPSEPPEVTAITGTKGRITLNDPAHCPTSLEVHTSGELAPHRYMTENLPAPSESFEYPLPEGLQGVAPGVNQGGFIYVLEAVHRCLAAGLTVCPQYNQAESLRTLELVDAASLWKVTRFLDPETMESEKQRYEEMEAKAKL